MLPPCPSAPIPRLLNPVLCRTQQMFAKRINNGKHSARKEILHKRFSKAIGHLKPASQETTNCYKKGRSQPGTIPQGREHVLWFIKSLGMQVLSLTPTLGSAGTFPVLPPYPDLLHSFYSTGQQGSLGSAGFSDVCESSHKPWQC